MKYLFLADSTGNIEFSCAGFIYDLCKKDDVHVIVCNSNVKEVTAQFQAFKSLGVKDENILVNSFELAA